MLASAEPGADAEVEEDQGHDPFDFGHAGHLQERRVAAQGEVFTVPALECFGGEGEGEGKIDDG